MSKNKDKKAKEVKEEIKTPSAEVSENGAEMETEAGKEEVVVKTIGLHSHDWLADIEAELFHLSTEGHHNKLAIDQAVNDAKVSLAKLESLIKFIEKALSEKKK